MISQTIHLPPEWAPQSAIIISWPNHTNTWSPSLKEVEQTFVQIAKTIAQYQKLIINCLDESQIQQVKNLLQQAAADTKKIKLAVVPTHDIWVRDYGPITVLKAEQPILLDFIFNAWGNKYAAEIDNQATSIMHKLGVFAQTKMQNIDFILEGGSIEVDGRGTLLTTESCLLTNTRNNKLSKKDIEKKLCDFLGLQQILWLKHGSIAGDDTDGHIDTLARFVNESTICYVKCDDPKDEHFIKLAEMEKQLQTFRDTKNQPYHLVPLPWPAIRRNQQGARLPATYANFLIMNEAVLVPTYACKQDELALMILQECFPTRKIIGINCNNLIEQYGSLHCATMQLPAGVVK